ncbi:uncharacterized protein [Apostichopus japonicus]|uniref:uncharacterized protein n=1 Tax=Stichopus japonicus TaxID=307972 RepID=UPI003AB6BA5C
MESFLSQTLLLLLGLTSVVLGCGPQSQSTDKKSNPSKGFLGANYIPPASHYNSKSKRSLFDHLEEMTPEEDFLRFDINEDGFIDACEWTMVQFSNNSVREFIRLLDQADLDDNELLSLDEFIFFESKTNEKKETATRIAKKLREFIPSVNEIKETVE